jgi:hypothetical protein
MAVVYVSYKSDDHVLVTRLVTGLRARGHEVLFDESLYVGVAWREHLMKSLLKSDVMLLVWTDNTHGSQYVPAEVGAVRAMPDIGLLPVLVGPVPVPPFIQDVHVARLAQTSKADVTALLKDIDRSIALHLQHRTARRAGEPKLFISHRHKDEEVVRALVRCLELRFELDRTDLRCTSIQPYRLPVGENTADRLRHDISMAEVVLGILTTDTLSSSYVAFELGSAWGQKVWTCPLLAGGADQSHVPDPIRGLSSLFLTKAPDCRQLLDDLEDVTSLRARSAVEPGFDEAIDALVAAAARHQPS